MGTSRSRRESRTVGRMRISPATCGFRVDLAAEQQANISVGGKARGGGAAVEDGPPIQPPQVRRRWPALSFDHDTRRTSHIHTHAQRTQHTHNITWQHSTAHTLYIYHTPTHTYLLTSCPCVSRCRCSAGLQAGFARSLGCCSSRSGTWSAWPSGARRRWWGHRRSPHLVLLVLPLLLVLLLLRAFWLPCWSAVTPQTTEPRTASRRAPRYST